MGTPLFQCRELWCQVCDDVVERRRLNLLRLRRTSNPEFEKKREARSRDDTHPLNEDEEEAVGRDMSPHDYDSIMDKLYDICDEPLPKEKPQIPQNSGVYFFTCSLI